MQIIHSAEGETVERSTLEIFEGGQVWARGLTGSEGSQDFNALLVQFAAGARTVMHRHGSDQLLYVIAGIGKVGDTSGENVISAGDSVVIPANTDHWHGAYDTGSPMSHISVTAAGSETTLS
jgi:quercetin dioxygenase-like cupin family protein